MNRNLLRSILDNFIAAKSTKQALAICLVATLTLLLAIPLAGTAEETSVGEKQEVSTPQLITPEMQKRVLAQTDTSTDPVSEKLFSRDGQDSKLVMFDDETLTIKKADSEETNISFSLSGINEDGTLIDPKKSVTLTESSFNDAESKTINVYVQVLEDIKNSDPEDPQVIVEANSIFYIPVDLTHKPKPASLDLMKELTVQNNESEQSIDIESRLLENEDAYTLWLLDDENLSLTSPSLEDKTKAFGLSESYEKCFDGSCLTNSVGDLDLNTLGFDETGLAKVYIQSAQEIQTSSGDTILPGDIFYFFVKKNDAPKAPPQAVLDELRLNSHWIATPSNEIPFEERATTDDTGTSIWRTTEASNLFLSSKANVEDFRFSKVLEFDDNGKLPGNFSKVSVGTLDDSVDKIYFQIPHDVYNEKGTLVAQANDVFYLFIKRDNTLPKVVNAEFYWVSVNDQGQIDYDQNFVKITDENSIILTKGAQKELQMLANQPILMRVTFAEDTPGIVDSSVTLDSSIIDSRHFQAYGGVKVLPTVDESGNRVPNTYDVLFVPKVKAGNRSYGLDELTIFAKDFADNKTQSDRTLADVVSEHSLNLGFTHIRVQNEHDMRPMAHLDLIGNTKTGELDGSTVYFHNGQNKAGEQEVLGVSFGLYDPNFKDLIKKKREQKRWYRIARLKYSVNDNDWVVLNPLAFESSDNTNKYAFKDISSKDLRYVTDAHELRELRTTTIEDEDGSTTTEQTYGLTVAKSRNDFSTHTFENGYLQLTEEGIYDIAYEVKGAREYFHNDELEDSKTLKVIVDKTAPEISAMELFGKESVNVSRELAKSNQNGEKDTLIGGERTLDFTIQDPNPKASSTNFADPKASGLSDVEVHIKYWKPGVDPNTGEPSYITLTPEDKNLEVNGDKYSLTLSEPGLYKLDQITIKAKDNAGNSAQYIDGETSRNYTAADFPIVFGEGEDEATINTIIVDNSEPKFGFEIVNKDNESAPIEVDNLPMYGSEVQAYIWIQHDPWVRYYASTDAFADEFEGKRFVNSKDAEGEELSLNTETQFELDDEGVWKLPIDLTSKDEDHVLDGKYKLKFDYKKTGKPAKSEFLVDTTAPQITDAEIATGLASNEFVMGQDIAEYDNKKILVGGKRTIRLHVQDLLPDTEIPTEFTGDEKFTAGIKYFDGKSEELSAKDQFVIVQITKHNSLNDKDEPETLKPKILKVKDGFVDIHLDESGLYSLSDIKITVLDNVENKFEGTLKDCVADKSETWNFDHILVDAIDLEHDKRRVDIQVRDDKDTPPSDSPKYHRGKVDITVSIKDPWFAIYQKLEKRHENFFTIRGIKDDNSNLAPYLANLTPLDFTFNKKLGVWIATYDLPQVGDDDQQKPLISVEEKDDRPIEGTYSISIDYSGVSVASDATQFNRSFGIDYTAPNFGTLTSSIVDPYKWGWIFPREDITLSIDATDNLSGVNTNSILFSQAHADVPNMVFDEALGKFTVTFTGDRTRLLFDLTSIKLKDIAGNKAVIDNIAKYKHTNIPERTTGFSIDTIAPTLEVAYVNNDVVNGRYYNEHRSAVVTIQESNFDLVKQHDPGLVIATATLDGREMYLTARDFENPSGDGITWVATFDFDQDGDWTFSAQFTDPAGRTAEPHYSEFTIDTTPPVLLVTFDNNEVENGMYFKNPRTATIEVRERNFDESLTPVTTTAKDGSAPGISGWKTSGDLHDRVSTTTVHFGNETHYTLTAACTDLAGNTAEVVEIPEFVIDLTDPVIKITNVENNTAYGKAIRPQIEFQDTNFDPHFAMYKLTGSNRGDVYMQNVSEKDHAEGKHVAFGDFEYVLENDDIYTLKAELKDLSGRTAEQTVVFSVNRFGSNYEFLGETKAIRGDYLQNPPVVRVREINVSGIDTDQSRVEVTHDTRVKSLDKNNDFKLEQVKGKNAWSETLYTLPKELFSADGYYRVFLTSKDAAGNLSQNTMDKKDAKREGTAELNFAVDGTNPTASLIGLESGGVYLNPNLSVQVDVQDNMGLNTTTLAIDGEDYITWAKDKLEDYSFASFEYPTDGKAHAISLTTTDLAGNKTVVYYDNVFVTKSWFKYILKNPTLLNIAIMTIVVVVALILIAVALYRRRRRKTARRRNPFSR